MRHLGVRKAGTRAGGAAARQRGFSLIEVLVALVVLAIGLLGLALMQTMNLRYTKSAQQRTLAVNLANDLLDTMRANRSQIAVYSTTASDFDTVSVPSDGCATNAAMLASSNIVRWRCEVKEALGTDATAVVDVTNAPVVEVTVRWEEPNVALTESGRIVLSTQL